MSVLPPTRTILALAFCTLVLAGCGTSDSDINDRRVEVLDRAQTSIEADLGSAVTRAWHALGELETAVAGVGDSAGLFQLLDTIRDEHQLDGLVLDGPTGRNAWAGRTLDRRPLPAEQPWEHTFQSGALRYHEGPFVRALEVERADAYATIILEEDRPGDEVLDAFRKRWLDPLGLRSVEILPRGLTTPVAAGDPDRRVFEIVGVDPESVLAVEIRSPGPEATRERMENRRETRLGVVLLVLLTAFVWTAAALVIRHVGRESRRDLSFAALTILARQLLLWIELGSRFDALASVFSPDVFAVATPLGWLSSPADFAISSIAYLLVATFLVRAMRNFRPVGSTGRIGVAVTAPPVVAGVAAIWMWAIERAVFGGQTTFFRLAAILPEAENTLMLIGLVVITATAFLITAFTLRAAAEALPKRIGIGRRLLPLVAGLGLTCLASPTEICPSWAILALPIVASLGAGRPPPRRRIGLPSRVLILSAVATAILFPALWLALDAREQEQLPTRLEALLDRESFSAEVLETTLTLFGFDPYLQSELARASAGARPDGLAFSLWTQTDFRHRGDPGIVTVLDKDGRQKDQFVLEAIPQGLIPLPAPQGEDRPDVDVQVQLRPRGARAVVGRLRVRDEQNDVVGYVVIVLPNLLDIVLLDLVDVSMSPGAPPTNPLRQSRGLQFATLRDGVVETTNDPTVPRVPGGFGPDALVQIPDQRTSLSWDGDHWKGYARWQPSRGMVVGVRRADPDFGDVLLALARMLVVGVGLGMAMGLVFALATLRDFRPQLHHKILLSYLVISVVPLVLLGFASAREAESRFDSQMSERLRLELGRVRGFMEKLEGALFDTATDRVLARWAADERHDVLLYRDGDLEAASRTGLADAELLSSRLPPVVYEATVLEARETVRREVVYAGSEAWIGYAPILDPEGRVVATVAVPRIYDRDRMQAEVSVTGSAMLAGYLLALVLVLVIGIYAARNLTQPLRVLASGTKRVASGELDLELPGEGDDELGELVRSFNAMTRELRETTERAAAAEREMAWRRMARQVAHEIRNPLTPLRLMIQQLEAVLERDPETAHETIRQTIPVLLRQIEALQKIAGDFANFARLPQRDLKPVDIGEIVEHVTALHLGASEQGIIVKMEVDEDLPTVVWDEEELRRVLLNLVGNAVQSISDEGTVTVYARRSMRSGDLGVMIAVEDDGVGIPDENRERLFEPHFSTKTSGTGLGLAIVARIVEDLGGTIDVESTEGAGSTFRVWLPSSNASIRAE